MAEPEPRVAIASRSQIGESPLWKPSENSLYWVDVEGKSVQRWNTLDDSVRSWGVGQAIGCIGLRKRGGLVGAMQSGFFFLDGSTGQVTLICDPETDLPDNRFNDGKVDRRGRFWAGTRNFRDHAKADGALYRLDADLSTHRLEEGLRCPNGMAWSPDDRLMYLCDTWARRIFVYDFDADDGIVRNRRLFAELKEDEGFPDGLTVDADGCIWNAHYNGWRVSRYTPGGAVDRTVRMPVQHVTSLTFGGSDCRTLYITSGCLRLTDQERKVQATAGHVFSLDTHTPGLPEPLFTG